MPVSIPAQTLPSPSISVSRSSSSQGTVTFSNYASYPSGCVAYINGTQYPLQGSYTLSITLEAVSVSLYVAYQGDKPNISTPSATASGTILRKLATPQLSITVILPTLYVDLENASSYSAETEFYIELEYFHIFNKEWTARDSETISKGDFQYALYDGDLTATSSMRVRATASLSGAIDSDTSDWVVYD